MRSTINPRARAARHHAEPPIEDKPKRVRRKRSHREAKAQARLVKAADPDIKRAGIDIAVFVLGAMVGVIVFALVVQ